MLDAVPLEFRKGEKGKVSTLRIEFDGNGTGKSWGRLNLKHVLLFYKDSEKEAVVWMDFS